MQYRRLGKTGFDVSEISLGTWQVGGRWGSGFDDANAEPRPSGLTSEHWEGVKADFRSWVRAL